MVIKGRAHCGAAFCLFIKAYPKSKGLNSTELENSHIVGDYFSKRGVKSVSCQRNHLNFYRNIFNNRGQNQIFDPSLSLTAVS